MLYSSFIRNSQLIRTVGYGKGILQVELKNGSVYLYRVNRKRAYNRFLKAPSKGRHFNKFIKKFYPLV